jgi:hypothetical protein
MDLSYARARVQRFSEVWDRPATVQFVALTLAVVWFATFLFWRCDYRAFNDICNHDPGAVLRLDEVISQGARPGADFFYYYGLLPVFISHVFFGVFGHSPLALFELLFAISCCSYVGLAWTISAFRPSRLGALLLAIAAGHATFQATPTHALETALLVWAVALRIRGRNTGALVVASVALFAKMSMPTVILAEFAGLSALDAVRTRTLRPLLPLLVIPTVFLVGAGLSIAWMGVPAFISEFNAPAAAALYRAYDLGFFREGRHFWSPVGHTLGWYTGFVAGPWCVGSMILAVLAVRGAVRSLRAAFKGAPRDISEETLAMCGFANLAFVLGFYGPAISAYYYTWLVLVGMTPILARAKLGLDEDGVMRARPWAAAFGWVSLSVALLLSQTTAAKHFVHFARERTVNVGSTYMNPDQADELKATLALGHSVGGGVIAAIARTANFGLVDPTIREGHYWMLLVGAPMTKAVTETAHLAQTSDTIFVTKFDYAGGLLTRIPAFKAVLDGSERLHDGKYFLLLRGNKGASPPPTPLPTTAK